MRAKTGPGQKEGQDMGQETRDTAKFEPWSQRLY